MNGIHDLGGMHGFSPIEREADIPFCKNLVDPRRSRLPIPGLAAKFPVW